MSYPTEYDRGVRSAQIALEQDRRRATTLLRESENDPDNAGYADQGYRDELRRVIKEDRERDAMLPQAPITLAEATHTTLWNALWQARALITWLSNAEPDEDDLAPIEAALLLKPAASGAYTVVLSSELEDLRKVRARYQDLLDGTGQGSLSWWFARCNAKSLAIKDLQTALRWAADLLDSTYHHPMEDLGHLYHQLDRAKEALLGDAPSP